jgi:putative ABC transport system permease protein
MSDIVSFGRRASVTELHPWLDAGMTTRLAWRNLTLDRGRFAVTLVGIVFAVVLMAIQSGLLYGFATTASSLIDRAGADIWIGSTGVLDVDQTVAIGQNNRFEALAVPGVVAADKYIVKFADWRRPDGGAPSVLVVGFDLTSGVGGPWNLVAGRIEDLRQPDAVIIDELYREKLGVTRLGQTVEINGRRARIVGFTSGIRTFTQSPYVFTSFKNAQTFTQLDENQTSYVLLKLAEGVDIAAIKAELQATLHDVDIMPAVAFSGQTQKFWLFTTGAGTAVLLGAVLGLIIGIVITGQTLYAATMDRLPEYATLRAMGAPPAYLYRVIMIQAVIAGLIGYGIGIVLAEGIVFMARNGSAAMLLPYPLALFLAVVTIGMCGGGAMLSIRKLGSLRPTSAFR